MAIPFKFRELQRMTSNDILQALGDQVGVVYVDSQPRFRIISFRVKPPHDDSQAKPNVADVAKPVVYDDSQRKILVRGRGWVYIDADGNALPEDF